MGTYTRAGAYVCRCPLTNESYMFTDPERSHPEQLIDLARRHGVSIIKVYRMARLIVSDMIDPVPFEERVGTFEFEWNGAPDPFANIDLTAALGHALRAARRNDQLLQAADKLTLRTVLDIFRCTVAWSKFWAERHPDPIWRERFAQEVEAAKADAREIMAKARAKGLVIKDVSDG